jgi:hypothetical protein
VINTMPRAELRRRLAACRLEPGEAPHVKGRPQQLRLADVARYIGRSQVHIRNLAADKAEFTDRDQLLLSRMFLAVDRGELALVKTTKIAELERVKPAKTEAAPQTGMRFGIDITASGPRLRKP